MDIHDIPAINALLNSVATVLIILGFALIKASKPKAHRLCMTLALVVSTIFLIGYVYHKIAVKGVHTPFGGEGLVRSLYYAMLISHILLAMAIVPLVLRTVFLAVKNRLEQHRKWAKWTFPLWLYVSVTGVLVYLCLYVWYPPVA